MSTILDAITPKSDQLNADDLRLRDSITVTIQSVTVKGGKEQPVWIEIDGGFKTYKPCKSMLRVLGAAWGVDTSPWVGRRMTLYCDPDVRWSGEPVGGIRISHLSHIDERLELRLTVTRGKKAAYIVEPLADRPAYPQSKFDELFPKWQAAVESGKADVAGIIGKIETQYTLTDEQRREIESIRAKGE